MVKTCPICKARVFDDMDICYGCMHRFEDDVASELATELAAGPTARPTVGPATAPATAPAVKPASESAIACATEFDGEPEEPPTSSAPVAPSAAKRNDAYALIVELDAAMLQKDYGIEKAKADGDIDRALEPWGFASGQSSIRLGKNAVTPVTCVLAVQKLASSFAWFAPCVKSIHMVRLTKDSDLMAVVADYRTQTNGQASVLDVASRESCDTDWQPRLASSR